MNGLIVRIAAHRVLVAAILAACSLSAWGQSQVRPEDEYKKLIKVNEEIQPLGENPFGENISLYNGALSFQQTDVSIPGTGPTITLTRSYKVREAKESEAIDGAFADWDIEIPAIVTMTANQNNVRGWVVNNAAQPQARCSQYDEPPTVVQQQGGSDWDPAVWWNGYSLDVPGVGGQELLWRINTNTLSPQMPGLSFPLVTTKNWMVSCLSTTDGSAPGEGFLAVAPDGTKYWFNHLVYRWAPTLHRPIGTPTIGLQAMTMQPMVAVDDYLERREGRMEVTRIEDRFGNYITYNYDGDRLASITGSDGRALTFTYVDAYRVSTATITAGNGTSRQWQYQYADDRYKSLLAVVQPDGRSWSFGLTNFLTSDMNPDGGTCNKPALLSTDTWTGTITHPSGLKGEFVVKGMVHGRSYVPQSCVGGTTPDAAGTYALIPIVYYQLTVQSKKFSGAGMPTRLWQYAYSPANASWAMNCANGCATSVWTDVTNPDQSTTRTTFSNRYDWTESQLQRTDYYSGEVGSTLLRSEINSYAPPTTGPWPAQYGNTAQSRANRTQLQTMSPLSARQIDQDGNSYLWQATAFDIYGNVTQTTRSNNVPGQIAVSERTAYLNDLPHWVLGLPQQIDNLNNNETVDKYDYDLSNVTLAKRYHFGQPVMSYTFDAQGQLASFTDGKQHTTTLGNYKRGIPQSIGYPDTKSQSLVVDDFGQITSITDQAGATTSYTYDPVGRITRIDYPSNDEVAWYPKTFDYAFVGVPEQGVPANHWRRVTTKGNAVTTTYFDAMLRPVLSTTAIASTGTAISARTDYDWKGQKTFVSYPVNGTPDLAAITAGTSSTYDALGRLTLNQQVSELGTLTTITSYLPGARKQITDPKNYVTTTSYQVFDQPSYDAVIQVQAPEGVNQSITRDLYGNPTQIHQWGNANGLSGDVTKTLVYDSYHRLCRTSEPESGSEVTAYDDANNVAWTASGLAITGTDCGYAQVPAAAQTTRSYDPMNRVLTLAPPAGTQSTTYTYDPLGNVHTASYGVTLWTGFRNKLGQLMGESLQVDGQDLWRMGYAHDAYGSVSTIQYPDGEAVSYAPDALGRATQAGSYATGVNYYPDGDVASFTFGNGDSYAVQKNARQLLSNFTYGNGGALKLSEDYAYDANGNITSITDLAAGTRTKTFGYDTLNRLTNAQANSLWGTESYGYDPINNIRSRVSGGQTFTYNYDATNRLTSITQGANAVVTLGYDNRGNVNSRNGATLNFDQKNQLTDIPGYDSYQYDAAGRRVIKTPANGAGATYYFYTQAGQLVYAFDASASKATNYIYLGKKLIARNESLKLSNPASITFSANASGGNYTVNWTAVPGATGYNLQVSADGGTTWNVAGNGTLTGTSLAVLNQEGGGYLYRVQACAASGCVAGWTVSSTVGVAPVAPAITVPSGFVNGNYTVTWTAPASATSYDVQEAVDGGAWNTIATDTTATQINRPGTTSGSYTYQVQAKNAYGTRGWVTSNAVTVDTTYGVIPPEPASLTVPAASADGAATLSWASVSQITHYVVQQSSDNGSSWTNVYDGTATTFALTGLANGNYQYQVEACNAHNCSSWKAGSNLLVVTHPPTGAPTLTVPANSTNGSYTISWTTVSTATSYTLQESTNGGSTWSTVQSNGNTSWATSGRGNGSYGYRVQACNVGGCGGWSSAATTTVLLPPPTPTGVTVPSTSNGPIPISWNASPTATRYDVYQSINGGGWTQVYSGASTSITVTATSTGSYQFFVTANNASGWNSQVASSAVVAVTVPPSGAPSISAPASSSTGSYTVSWSGVGGATYYNLQEQLNGGGWTLVQANGSTSWGASGRGNGTYGYVVQACNAGGCGPWSSTSAVVVTLIPATPSNPQVAWTSGTSAKPFITVSWSAIPGATTYKLEQTHPQLGVSQVYSGPNTSYGNTIFATGVVKFRVQACNVSGCSAWGTYGSITLNSGIGL